MDKVSSYQAPKLPPIGKRIFQFFKTESATMAKNKGFRVAGQGVIMDKSVFTPADKPGMSYHTLHIGYLGGKIRASCSAAVAGMAEDGAEVDFRGNLFEAKGDLKLEITEIGAAGSLARPNKAS